MICTRQLHAILAYTQAHTLLRSLPAECALGMGSMSRMWISVYPRRASQSAVDEPIVPPPPTITILRALSTRPHMRHKHGSLGGLGQRRGRRVGRRLLDELLCRCGWRWRERNAAHAEQAQQRLKTACGHDGKARVIKRGGRRRVGAEAVGRIARTRGRPLLIFLPSPRPRSQPTQRRIVCVLQKFLVLGLSESGRAASTMHFFALVLRNGRRLHA
jgi:hypothetical protein